jgi:hypothetical protein
MKPLDVWSWLRVRCEPIPFHFGGIGYRAAADLWDGTELRCVLFAPAQAVASQLNSRLVESRTLALTDPSLPAAERQFEVLKQFACRGNRVDSEDIAVLRESAHAIPYGKIENGVIETSDGLKRFGARMEDGKVFSFATERGYEFFAMPPGYSAAQITEIIAARDVLAQPLREKPFFMCFLDSV